MRISRTKEDAESEGQRLCGQQLVHDWCQPVPNREVHPYMRRDESNGVI